MSLALVPARPRPLPFAVLALAWAAGMHALASLPGSSLPRHGALFDLAYNLAHAPLHFGLAALLSLAFLRGVPPRLAPRRALLAFALAAGFGVLEELHQARVKGRSADPLDAVTNACGAALAVWIVLRAARGARPLLRPAMVLPVLLALAAAAAAAGILHLGAHP